MAKAYSIREVALREGVTEADFERFLREEFPRVPQFPGTRSYVLKGVRGQHTGGYLWIMEWESMARWQQSWPAEGQPSDELRAWNDAQRGQPGLYSYVTVPGGAATAYTVYEEVGDTGG